MSDAALVALNLEPAQQIEELQSQLPMSPVMELSRRAFEALSAADRMAFVKRKGRLYDAAPTVRALRDGEMRRSEWDKLDHARQRQIVMGGTAVVD